MQPYGAVAQSLADQRNSFLCTKNPAKLYRGLGGIFETGISSWLGVFLNFLSGM